MARLRGLMSIPHLFDTPKYDGENHYISAHLLFSVGSWSFDLFRLSLVSYR